MSRRGLPEPAKALLHPVFVASLGVLVLNDHVLKGSGLLPGWLTGKLSDFAGLLVAPIVLSALLRARSRRGVAMAHLAVGAGFAALEMSASLTAAMDSLYRLAGFTWRSWSDPTDLLALAVLPLSYWLVLRASGAAGRAGASAPVEEASRRPGAEDASVVPGPVVVTNGARLLGAAGLLACAASSGGWAQQQPLCGNDDCDLDGYYWPEDCNDADPQVNPYNGNCPDPIHEPICNDGKDNDSDGLADCDDDDCAPACVDLKVACASVVTMDFETVGLLTGSTLVGSSVSEGSCVGADSPEVIFRGQVGSGLLTIGVPPGHGIVVRADCEDATNEMACGVYTGKGGAGGTGGTGGAGGATGGAGGMTGGAGGATGGAGGMTNTGGTGGAGGITGGAGGMTSTGGTGGAGGTTGGAGGVTNTGGTGGAGGMTGTGGTGIGGDVVQIVTSPSTLYIIVEALDPFQAGPFEVPVAFTSSTGCGDGVRGPNEVCDDGNTSSLDGCSSLCQAEPEVLCAQMPTIDASSQIFGSFAGASRSFGGECVGTLDTPERGYHYTTTTGDVTVSVDAEGDVGLYAMIGCGPGAIPVSCVDAGGGLETLSLSVAPGTDLTFFVELANPGDAGQNFTLTVAEP